MPALFANNAVATLAADVETHHTQLTLQTGHGALFPSPDADLDEFFLASLVTAGGEQEIVKITARDNDTLTVDRGQETTIPRAFATGDKLELRLTSGSLSGFVQREETQAASSSRLKNAWYVAASPAIADHGDATARGSLAWVLAQVGVSRAEIHLPAEHAYTIATDLTVPGSVTLVIHRGAVLDVAGTTTLTLNADLRAGCRRIFSGTGTVTGTLGGSPAVPQWWGAVADGATDDSEAVEQALAFAHTAFAPGVYVLTRPLALTAHGNLHGPAPLAGYMDWNTDWQESSPSYVGRAAILQYPDGQHGAMFTAADHVSFENLAFRCGQVRTPADAFISGEANHLSLTGCRFENLETLLSGSSSFGGFVLHNCKIFGCGTAIQGPLVDAVVEANTFTSCGVCLELTEGAGLNLVSGNRFEWSTQAIKAYRSRANTISGNVFDACEEAAVTLHDCEHQVLTDNVFWRNGRDGLESEKRSHLVLKECKAGNVVRSNAFVAGGEDTGGEDLWPKYVVETVSCAGARVVFHGNSMHPGCLEMPFYDTWWNSDNGLDIDEVHLPGIGNPDQDSDQLIEIVKRIDKIACGPVDVRLYEDRAWTVYTDLSGGKICLKADGSVTLRDTTGRANRLLALQGVAYGRTFGDAVSAMTADGPPTLGFWQRGIIVWNTFPASGQPIGWVCTAEGAPGTWNAFGTVA